MVLGVVFAAIIAWLAHLFRGLFGGGGGEVVQEEARLSAEGGQPTELDPADRPSSVTTQGFTKKAPQYLSGKAEGFFGHTSAVAREAGYTWLSAAGLLVVFGTLYAVLGPVLHPESSLQDIVPAIAYVLVLMVLVAATLSFFTLWLDKYRIPLLTAVIFTGIFAHSGTGLDHFFAVETPKSVETATESEQSERSADAKQKNGSELVSAFDAWNSTHSTIPVATVITASGGGITAAYWSALVLANLSSEMDENLDFEFGSSVVAVSSVSGGAVGTMGFVRAFDQVGVPNSDDLEELVAQAGRSSLGAVGWGLVYPDFWRILLPDWMNPGGAPHDRGWALERRWSGISDVGDETLCSWRYETLAGWRPVAFLNATVVETGERLVLSPLNTNASGDRSKIFCQAGKFHELCPGYDIKVVTAARLSSTFPYVSPISRPEISEVKYAYHVADGGYYDNFGVLTALDYLRVTEERIKAAKRKILLIQIRLSGTEAAASAKAEAKTPEASKPGYLSIFIGPVTTLMNVRTPSQIARNDQFVEELIKDWGKDQVKTVTFTLGRDAPLSWHLSDSDKDSIAEAWCSEANRDQLEQLKKFLGVMPEQAKKSIQCDG